MRRSRRGGWYKQPDTSTKARLLRLLAVVTAPVWIPITLVLFMVGGPIYAIYDGIMNGFEDEYDDF